MNILFIVIDCLRAMSCSAYGYERKTTPNIDELAKRGVLARTAITQSSFTLSSAASILTGLYPEAHGTVRFNDQLPYYIMTLPEYLSTHGFATTCYEGLTWFDGQWGLQRGFDYIESFRKEKRQRKCRRASAEEIYAKFTTNLTSPEQNDLPFFSLLWFADAHTPYFTPEKESRYFGQSVKGNSKIDQYDSAIRYVDHYIGKLLEVLDKARLLDDTFIAVTGDHGDVFDEHYRLETKTMGRLLYKLPFFKPILTRATYPSHIVPPWDEVIRVPLIMKFPHNELKGEITEQVELIDLFPTILDLLKLETRPTFWQGKSMLPLLKGDSQNKKVFAYSYTTMDNATAIYTCVQEKGFKYIKIYPPTINLRNMRLSLKRFLACTMESGESLWQVETGEKHNLSKEYPEKRHDLRKELRLWHTKNQILKERMRVHQVIANKKFRQQIGNKPTNHQTANLGYEQD